MITRNEAADRIALFASEGRLIQSRWHSEHDGRELACLLGAVGSDVNSPYDCPAEVMPAWMAYLLPVLFDGVRPERAMEYGARFANALKTGRTDDGVKRAFLIATVEQDLASATPAAPAPDYWPAVEAACRDTILALRADDSVALKKAETAAWAAAGAAEAAWAAAGAAWAAAAAAAAKAGAAKAAARAAAWAAAWAAAAERLFDALLAEMIDVDPA